MNCPVHTISTRRDALDDARKVLADAYEDIGDIRLIPALGNLDGEIRGLDFALRLLTPSDPPQPKPYVGPGEGQITKVINETPQLRTMVLDAIGVAAGDHRDSPQTSNEPLCPDTKEEPAAPPFAEITSDPEATSDALEPAPAPSVTKPLTQKDRVLLAYQDGHTTGADIAKATGIGRGSVDAVISVLRREGKLVQAAAVPVKSMEVPAKPRVPF